MATVVDNNDEFTAFWNDVLVPKFERFRNIMMGGLSHHSVVPLAKLELARGSRAVDVGCGWGDTAIELARKVGPAGRVLGLDCCDAFSRRDETMPRPRGYRTSASSPRTCRRIRSSRTSTSLSRASA